jgi:hypothetical protein
VPCFKAGAKKCFLFRTSKYFFKKIPAGNLCPLVTCHYIVEPAPLLLKRLQRKTYFPGFPNVMGAFFELFQSDFSIV